MHNLTLVGRFITVSWALRCYSYSNGVLDAWGRCLYRCLSKPFYVAHFLFILYRKKRKVGTVRDDALVMTKILYSRGTSDRVEQYIRLIKP
jgi:hypothetical protein